MSKPKKVPLSKYDLSFVDIFYRYEMERFIIWRKNTLKKPYKTDVGIHRLYNRLVEFAKGDTKRLHLIIQQSIDKEWVDVYNLTREYEQGINIQCTERQQQYQREFADTIQRKMGGGDNK